MRIIAYGAGHIAGVDLSPEMVRIARRKYPQSHIEVRCADIEETRFDMLFDCCVVYNALPHFSDPERLIGRLARFVKPGGRLCIAHGMSLSQLIKHHEGRASAVSRPLPEIDVLLSFFKPWFFADVVVSDEEKVILAGQRITADE